MRCGLLVSLLLRSSRPPTRLMSSRADALAAAAAATFDEDRARAAPLAAPAPFDPPLTSPPPASPLQAFNRSEKKRAAREKALGRR